MTTKNVDMCVRVCVGWDVWEYELNKRNKKGNIKNETHEKVSAATTTTATATSRWQFQFVELNLIKNQVEGHLREHCLPHASFAVIALSTSLPLSPACWRSCFRSKRLNKRQKYAAICIWYVNVRVCNAAHEINK